LEKNFNIEINQKDKDGKYILDKNGKKQPDKEKTKKAQDSNRKIYANISGNLAKAYDNKEAMTEYLKQKNNWDHLDLKDEAINDNVKSAIASAASTSKIDNLLRKGETEKVKVIAKSLEDNYGIGEVKATIARIANHPNLRNSSEMQKVVAKIENERMEIEKKQKVAKRDQETKERAEQEKAEKEKKGLGGFKNRKQKV